MITLIPALSGIFLPIILGLISRNGNFINPKHRPQILQFAVRICIPFMVFESMRQIETQTAGQFIPMTVGLFIFTGLAWLFMLGVILVLSPRVKWIEKYKGELLLMGFTGNIGYICWKIQEILIGPAGLQRGIFYTSFIWPMLIVYTILTVIILKLTKNNKIDTKSILYNIIPLLTMLALGLMVGLLDIILPVWLTSFTESFGPIAVPTVLFCMGLSISIEGSLKSAKILFPYLVIRLAIWIGATYLTLQLSFFDDLSRKVLLINMFAPIGINPIVLGDMFGLDSDFIANSITVSTVLYLLFLPVMFLLWG
jgi:predicted permease